MAADISSKGTGHCGRVLVCAPSNKATCLLLERFAEALTSSLDGSGISSGFLSNVVLLGVQDKILSVTSEGNSVSMNLLCWNELESLYEGIIAIRNFFNYAFKDIFDNLRIKSLFGNGHDWISLFHEFENEINQLRKDQNLVTQAAKASLGNAHVVFSTIGSAGQSILRSSSNVSSSSASSSSSSASYNGTSMNETGVGGVDITEYGASLEEPEEDIAWQNGGFVSVLIDEAGQAVEAETMIPISLGCQRLLLVGDPKQLPATITSQEAVKAFFGRSLLERLMGLPSSGGRSDSESLGNQRIGLPMTLLNTQYRMAEDISRFPNHFFYNGDIKSDPTTGRCLRWRLQSNSNGTEPRADSASSLRDGVFGGPFVWAHVGDELGNSGDSFHGYEDRDPYTSSIYNNKEASFIVDTVKWFVDRDDPLLDPSDIVVIAMYSAQVSVIRKMLVDRGSSKCASARVAVHTVDSFQGSECAVVIMSMVRSNNRHGKSSIGFLSDGRRLNVAITRAKDLLIVVGDGNTIRNSRLSASLGTATNDDDDGQAVRALFDDASRRKNVKVEEEIRMLYISQNDTV
eukprot:CAMPEP_0114370596 /NCGR_PEP_ID=MMETSP0101-20121206/32620_1 /TAXON_ID=38822 ORGANISM="Pteridomonas danica, Strain PT" /NCGR_SAMPLE_ID=MMETSP0101 /ASSEMBLY_ACC=CAM_ASM_000211 /LENGTH=572 /DNA_ID=CAMNT_0001522187 /DNA_START=373 /DNA_END=2091 /DNA_ORIENTATION=+